MKTFLIRIKNILSLLLLATLLFSSASFAENVVEVYQHALQNDPVFRAAKSTLRSAEEASPQAFANLLPFISATETLTGNRLHNKSQSLFQSGAIHHYNSRNFLISLTHPVINVANWAQVSVAGATVKQAAADYNAAVQDLIIRVAKAYFDVLEAEDTVRFTAAEKKANARQLDQAQQRYKVGLDAITSVYDAQASFDAVAARLIAAKNQLKNNREALREITGYLYPNLAKIKTNFPLEKPRPVNVEEWVSSTDKYNFQLIAARHAVDAAKKNITVNAAGHLPTVDLTASYDDSFRGSTGFGSTETSESVVGLKFNFPIFSGGSVFSKTKQAKYDYKTASSRMEAVHRSAEATTRQSYNSIVSGISIIKADKQAIISSQSSLDSTEAAFKVGTRTIVDVLDAQKNLFDAQRQLAADQYAYINDILKLRQAAGILKAEDLLVINEWLQQARKKV